MRSNPSVILWFIASIFLIGAVVYFVVTLQSLTPLKTNTSSLTAPAAQSVSASNSDYYGQLVKIPEGGLYGTHLLIDKDGKTLAYLESSKIDLKILEGSRVVVEGRRERMIEPGVPLLSVEKVSFKLND